MGPALGGGHGWLQGRHGLAADQWVSMNVVLADGTLRTIDNDDELMWAMKGAGHNFGIVTSVTTKIYDIQYRDWAIETFIFSGSQVEQVYQVANDKLIKNGTQDVDVIHWSYWLNIPDFDAEKVRCPQGLARPVTDSPRSPSSCSILFKKVSHRSTPFTLSLCATSGR